MKISAKLSITAAAMLLAVTAGVPALALGQASPRANAQADTTTTSTTDPGSQAADHKAAAQARLAATKLRVCQNRQKAITNIMARIADRGQKQLTLFGTIATRVENFYTQKGKTLADYNTLVANVNTQQTAAQSTVDAIKSASSGFSCDSSDPQAFVGTFKDSLKSEISALQAYRTSVKNLIVGVKSVQGTTTSAANQSNGGNQ